MTAITQTERSCLRELARRQLELAHLPEMAQKKQNWLDLNAGRPAVPPVVVETWTFDPDMMPDSVFRCETPAARQMEYQLLKNIREYELLHDDKVIPDYFSVPFVPQVDEFGIPIIERHAAGADGRTIGYEYESPIEDLEEDFHLLRPSTVTFDHADVAARRALAEETFGDILPVRVEAEVPLIALSLQMSKLLGLEGMMYALYDCPDTVHRLMDYLAENQIAVMRACEREGILTMNNGNCGLGVSSYCFTDAAPLAPDGRVSLRDLWIWAESEETASISPAQFREFFLPYVARAAREMGHIYYGCCEPIHPVLPEVLQAIPNIRKVSVSPWADQNAVGEMLRGSGIVFSRKPFANYLSIDSTFHEEDWKAHIRETLTAARGCGCEILMRDIYQADLGNVRRAVELARALAQDHRQ